MYIILTQDISSNRIKDMLGILTNMTKSESPLVKNSVANNLKFLLRNIPSLQNDGLDILRVLAKDPIDTIRISSVESIMFQVYDTKFFISTVWQVLKPLFEDSCWRVKYACILQIKDVRLSKSDM